VEKKKGSVYTAVDSPNINNISPCTPAQIYPSLQPSQIYPQMPNNTQYIPQQPQIIPQSPRNFMPPPNSQQVEVTSLIVKSAQNLKAVDKVEVMYPYCKIWFLGKLYRTEKIKGTLNPLWNYSINIPKGTKSPINVKVEIYDFDYYGPKTCLGRWEQNVDISSPRLFTVVLQKKESNDKVASNSSLTIEIK